MGVGTDINIHFTEEETEPHKLCQSQLDNDFGFELKYPEPMAFPPFLYGQLINMSWVE